ncbi:MAG: anti-virulence regulator CigR family protein [Woeseiaceae bacterium]
MRIAIVSLAGILILCLGPAVAADSTVVEPVNGSIGVEVAFTDEEVRLIRAWYQSHDGHNGKHKQKPLPPGIARNLARGKPLPPGIAKQVLPYELRQVLPPVRDGYERIIVAGKILLVEIATQVVRDVLTDVILD